MDILIGAYNRSLKRLSQVLFFSLLLFSLSWRPNESAISHSPYSILNMEYGLWDMKYAGGAPQEMPKEKGDFRAPDLVELVKLDSTIKLDIRYATSNNFLGRPVYKEA